jgi:CCR4-NOT transcription complex subunit 9
MTSLLQEIISVYTLLNPSQLTAAASNRVCNALALLQCVASHNETRALFLNGTVPVPVTIEFRLTTLISSHSALLVPFPQHYFEVTAVRILEVDLVRRNWSFGQE